MTNRRRLLIVLTAACLVAITATSAYVVFDAWLTVGTARGMLEVQGALGGDEYTHSWIARGDSDARAVTTTIVLGGGVQVLAGIGLLRCLSFLRCRPREVR
jgi:hypothetical protein